MLSILWSDDAKGGFLSKVFSQNLDIKIFYFFKHNIIACTLYVDDIFILYKEMIVMNTVYKLSIEYEWFTK